MPKIDIANATVRTKSAYPQPWRSITDGREKTALGDVGGLTQFGVNLTRLRPGAASSLRHWHDQEDEFIYVLEGKFDLILDGKEQTATAGDFIRLPMKIMHGLYNKSDQPIKCLFWVSPTGKLFELFKKIHNVPDPAEVTRLAALHDVNFLPPPPPGKR